MAEAGLWRSARAARHRLHVTASSRFVQVARSSRIGRGLRKQSADTAPSLRTLFQKWTGFTLGAGPRTTCGPSGSRSMACLPIRFI
jgi:hypothetical protein